MGVMTEVFAQVPPLAWILVVAFAVVVLWQVFNVLYVKPRDFRIRSLEKEVKSLKSAERQPESREAPASETAAGQSQANSPVKLPEPRTHAIDHPTDSSPKRGPEEEFTLAEGLRSLAFAISRLQDKDLTDLQKEAVEEYFTGKPVVWAATVESVKKAGDGTISVRIADGDKLFNTATASFEDAEREKLLKLQEGDRVVVSGTISKIFIGTPYLEQCSITKATGTSIAP